MRGYIYKILVLIPVLLILNSSLFIQNSNSQWVQCPINDADVNTFAASESNIYAGSSTSVSSVSIWSSTNNGMSWTQHIFFDSIFPNIEIPCIAIKGTNVYAGVNWGQINPNGGRIYLSTNNGTNWSLTSWESGIISSLAVSDNNIYAGGSGNISIESGVYLSTNNGNNWTQTSLQNNTVNSIVIIGNNIFAGTDFNGVYLSTNNGTNWTQTSLNDKSVLSLAISGNYIFAGTYNYGVYLSSNNGINWTQTSLNNQRINSLAINGNYILAGTYNYGVYSSSNNGINWIQKNEGFSVVPTVYALLIKDNYIFAGTLVYSTWRRPISEIIGIKLISEVVPADYKLFQNYPNPFNPETKIKFEIPLSKGD